MAKRKRETVDGDVEVSKSRKSACSANGIAQNRDSETPSTTTFQIITGSYERVLHGFTATLPQRLVAGTPADKDVPKQQERDDSPQPAFADTFLFAAHSSSIRCLALSPPSEESSKITLATGSTDERIHLYTLSTAPSAPSTSKPQLPSLHGTTIAENSKNKELGSLLHHSSSITALSFPTRSKLLSSAEDSTIAITRTRDWTPLSIIKAPIPKPQGRPSGDTAAPGEVPAGINDFAIHPSMKLMLSVGKGERTMRLWNLVNGTKAAVLNFGRDVLAAVGEGRFGTGEGRKVAWEPAGDDFAVAFERGAVIFGHDCKPKAKVLPAPRTKLHQMKYLPSESYPGTLLVSTEDGRVMLYDTNSTTSPSTTTRSGASKDKNDTIPSCTLIAQIGGPAAGITGRVKDFAILNTNNSDSTASTSTFLIVTGSSDGTVRLWVIDMRSLKSSNDSEEGKDEFTKKGFGKLVGTYSTGTRITCLTAFEMTGKAADNEDDAEVAKAGESSSDEDSD